MEISNLKARVMVQTMLQVKDQQGGYSTQWYDYIKIWAEIKPITDRKIYPGEIYENAQIKVRNFHEITIRYNEDLNESMRIIYRDKIYNIVRIIDVNGAGRFMQLIAYS